MKWMDEDRYLWAIFALIVVFFVAQMVRAFMKWVWL
jgi:hypothetical protein